MAARVRRWSWALLLVGPAAALLVVLLHPGPSGHWSGHLAAAGQSAGTALALVVGARLVRPRLPVAALASLAVVGVGLALEIVGNVRAARSLWGTTYDDAEAGRVGPLHPGYEWGHTVAARGDTLVIVGSLAFAVALGVSRRAGVAIAVAGGVLALFPPWIYPALAPLLLLVWLHLRPRADRRPRRGPSEPREGGHMPMHQETERLVIRPWRHEEAERLLDILSRIEVMQWLGDGVPVLLETVEQAHERIDRYAERDQPPLGMWAVERRSDGVVAGTVLLLTLPNDDHGEVEIGWHLHPDSWGHGYATEAARAVLGHGFAAGLPEIIAVAHTHNDASIAVMRRLGMTDRGVVEKWYDDPSRCYVMTAEDWAAQASKSD